ncbi:hypothetical protein D3C72_1925650 [compost metagenome]
MAVAPNASAITLVQAFRGAPASACQAAVPSKARLASNNINAPITVVAVVVVSASTPLSTSRPMRV